MQGQRTDPRKERIDSYVDCRTTVRSKALSTTFLAAYEWEQADGGSFSSVPRPLHPPGAGQVARPATPKSLRWACCRRRTATGPLLCLHAFACHKSLHNSAAKASAAVVCRMSPHQRSAPGIRQTGNWPTLRNQKFLPGLQPGPPRARQSPRSVEAFATVTLSPELGDHHSNHYTTHHCPARYPLPDPSASQVGSVLKARTGLRRPWPTSFPDPAPTS